MGLPGTTLPVNLQFTSSAYAQLVELRGKANAGSDAELIRKALIVFEWFLARQGGQVEEILTASEVPGEERHEDLKLFKVDVRYQDPHLSMLKTRGGTTSGVHEQSVFVSVISSKEAISVQWENMLRWAEQQSSRNSELFAKKKAGTISSAEEALIRSPRNPVQQDRWRAQEVVVPGHKILLIKVD